MTMTLIVAMIVAVIFAVFCVLGILAIRNNQKETQENSTRITNIESQLSLLGRQITQTTNRLERKIDGVESESVFEFDSEEVQPKIQPKQKGDYSKIEKIDSEISFDDFEIEEIDDDIEIENILSQCSTTPTTPTTPAPTTTPTAPTTHFQGYDVGRSGKKYTALELIEIIEE